MIPRTTVNEREDQKKINSLVNISNTKGRDNNSEAKTLIDTKYVRDTKKKENQSQWNKAKTGDPPTNKTEEYMDLKIVITAMKEAMDLDTLFDAIKEVQTKARNLITTARNKNPNNDTNARNMNDNKAEHLANIDNAVKLVKIEIINNALEEAQRKALNMINDTGNRPKPDDTLKILPNTCTTLSQTNPCLACIPTKLSQ